MRTVRIKLYNFQELKPAIQKKVLEDLRDINTNYNWWEDHYRDAEYIGINIDSFDTDKKEITGNLLIGLRYTVKAIHDNYDIERNIYKIASKFKKLDAQCKEFSEEQELITERFLNELLNEYLKRLTEDYDYLTSDSVVKESIEANEYEFFANGKTYTEPKK